MPKLFSYGTLQLDSVQQDTFGRLLKGEKDILEQYRLSEIEITDKKVIASSGTNRHPILKYTGNSSDFVSGTLYELTDEELRNADAYEVDDYKREALVFKSGTTGFVYVANTKS